MARVRTRGEWQDLDEEGLHQFKFAVADGKVVGIVLRHVILGSDPKDKVWCEIGLVQWEPWFGYRPLFTVTSQPGEFISLSPHIVCEICGDKGMIAVGKWVSSVDFKGDVPHEPMAVLEGNEVSGTQDGVPFSGVEDDEYEIAVRRDLGDKVPEEEANADNKIYDFVAKPEVDPDLERILAEEELIGRTALHRSGQAMHDELQEHYMRQAESPRKELLDRVASYILGDRNIAYGPPHVDFQRTAEMLTALWKWKLVPGAVIEAHDIANVVTLIKLSRIQWSPEKMDNWDDGAGYFACGWEAYVNTHPDKEIK